MPNQVFIEERSNVVLLSWIRPYYEETRYRYTDEFLFVIAQNSFCGIILVGCKALETRLILVANTTNIIQEKLVRDNTEPSVTLSNKNAINKRKGTIKADRSVIRFMLTKLE